MGRVAKSSAAKGGRLVYASNPESRGDDFSLELNPAELEALLERLCSCSTLRSKHRVREHHGERCPHGVRTQWCQLGQRGAGGERVETRFG
jgi:hypothetical protein